MSQLPKGWVEAPLAELTDILDSMRQPVSSKDRLSRVVGKTPEQLYPYYGATGQAGEIDDYLFDEELVALGEDGVPFFDGKKHKAYILKGKTWVNNHAHVLKGANGCLLNKYLCEYLNQFDYMGYVNGGTRLKLTQANMKRIPIKLAPLPEQKRIVEKLDEVLAQVDTIKARLDGIPDLLKRFRQSVLASAVSGKLTEEWRRDNGEDSSWKQITLKDAAHIQDPHPSHRTPPVVEGGIPFVSIGDLREDGSIDIENARKVSPEVLKEHKARYTLKEGDFIFGKIGTLGKATVLPMSVDFALSANVILIQPEISLAEPKYIQYFLSSPTTMDEVAKQANSTSQSAFGIKKMRAFVCSLPSKIEQTEIVRLVDQYFAFADTIEAQVKKAQARVGNLTQSILAKAFRGELVPQNDDDEPAEMLLERIAQARKEAEALAKAAKKAAKAKHQK